MTFDITQKKVLIIDDFAQMRSTLKQMLQSIRIADIDMAANGKEALELLARRAYDIVLCDYNLGEGKDGQQVLEEAKLRKLIRYSTIFVMITAENTMEMVMGAMEYKPDDYLTKPFNKELLRSRLEKLFIRKGDLEQIERAIQKREYRRAIELCDERIAKKPKNLSEFLKLKAHICLTIGDYEEAEAVARRVLAVRDVPWAMLVLGQVRFDAGNYIEAKDIFQEVVDKHRTNTEAYDWLSRTLTKLGENAQAQEILATAAKLSPKAILRQQALGDLAVKNNDLEIAERAYRKAVTLGRDSVYKAPNHYTKLAKVLSKGGAGRDAIKTLDAARKEFRGDQNAMLETTLAEGLVLKEQNRENDANSAFEEASKLFDSVGAAAGSELTMEMAKTCFLFGDKERGMRLMEDVVRNHHEDESVRQEAQQAFEAAGLGEEGKQVIATTTKEVVHLNNRGVNLVKQGKLEAAIELFEEAVSNMPNNRTVNLNAAQALLLFMQKKGKEDRHLYRVRQYLDQVKKVDPANSTLQKLFGIYEQMAAGA